MATSRLYPGKGREALPLPDKRAHPGILKIFSSLRSFPSQRIDLGLWVSGNSFAFAPHSPYDLAKPCSGPHPGEALSRPRWGRHTTCPAQIHNSDTSGLKVPGRSGFGPAFNKRGHRPLGCGGAEF